MTSGGSAVLLRSLAGTVNDFLLDWHLFVETRDTRVFGDNAGFVAVVVPMLTRALASRQALHHAQSWKLCSTQACQPSSGLLGMQPWCRRAVVQRDGVAAQSVFDQWITGRVTIRGKVSTPSTADVRVMLCK